MPLQRRFYNYIPEYLKTVSINQRSFMSSDILYEPEDASFISGFAGDSNVLSSSDKERYSILNNSDKKRKKYELSVGVVLKNDAGKIEKGIFYDDLVKNLAVNGALVNDENRLFASNYYTWTPPIDYDKHVNFSKYYWMGDGDAIANGNYIIKEWYGSQTYIYQKIDNRLEKIQVLIVKDFPSNPIINDFIEHSENERIIYRYNGTNWDVIDINYINTEQDINELLDYAYLHIPKNGYYYSKYTILKYNSDAGRYISYHPIVSNTEPDRPMENMIWENSSIKPFRRFYIYKSGQWQKIEYSTITSLIGIVEGYLYDIRNTRSPSSNEKTNGFAIVNDIFSQENLWVNYADLSDLDRKKVSNTDQAIRPIIEYWHDIEDLNNNGLNYSRNTYPSFNVYYADVSDGGIKSATSLGKTEVYTKMYNYKVGSGTDDVVMGFPLSYNSSGEYLFEIDIEKNTTSKGYKYFKDIVTGKYHSIWQKTKGKTFQNKDSDGFYDIPTNVKSNPNHINPLEISRSQYLNHMTSVIRGQNNFNGSDNSINNFRWSDKNMASGAIIIDSENNLLRTMGLLLDKNINIPDIIRYISKEYNRNIFNFINKLNERFEKGYYFNVNGALTVNVVDAVNEILTELYVNKNSSSLYYHSNMGTYVETIFNGVSTQVVDSIPKPILIPTSAVVNGASACYKPEIIIKNGSIKIRTHSGNFYNGYGDGRDLIILELENRFYNSVPDYYKTETVNFSSRFNNSNFILKNYYNNYIPFTDIKPVDEVVDSYTTYNNPVNGLRVYSKSENVFANYSGSSWFKQSVMVDTIFYSKSDNYYYFYNGFSCHKLELYNNQQKDYTINEFKLILRRDYERNVLGKNKAYSTNTTFDKNNKFTWNYSSYGLEGNVFAIYNRLFNTYNVESHPWELLGYTIEPVWWRTTYVPTRTEIDGTPRYSSNHIMWLDIKNGIYNKPLNLQDNKLKITAPLPIDINGNLLDPVTAGIIDINLLDLERIDDDWVYGDGGPVEQDFYNEHKFQFSLANCGYLMKPGLWVDINWSHLYIDIGKNQLFNGPHIVYNNTLTRPPINEIPVSLLDDNETLGLQIWISEYLNSRGISLTTSIKNIIKNIDVSLGWRTYGFINSSRTVIQKLSGNRIPYEDIHTVLHTTPPIEEKFHSGLIVSREGTGYRIYGFDLFKPYFIIDEPNIAQIAGLTELREQFTLKVDNKTYKTENIKLPMKNNTFDIGSMAVIINGLKISDQFYKITTNQTIVLDDILKYNDGDILTIAALTTSSNYSTQQKTFKVKNTLFSYATEGTNRDLTYYYGHYFDTSKDVINFMIGYGRKLQKDGWKFEEEENGFGIDWLYGAQLFASWAIERDNAITNETNDVQDFYFSPISRNAKFISSYGDVKNIESMQNGIYNIINSNLLPIHNKKIDITKINDVVEINTKTVSEDIYGIRINIIENQHVVFLSNKTKFEDIIYEPLLSLHVSAIKVDTYRTNNWNGKLITDGFILSDNNILPNFEKQTEDFTRYYDSDNPTDDPNKRDLARSLYGFTKNDNYMDPIGSDDRNRFNYYKGTLKTKGTVRAEIAFINGTKFGKNNVKINEDWAWKIGQFGDTREDIYEFKIKKYEMFDNPQLIRFTNNEKVNERHIHINAFDRTLSQIDSQWVYPPEKTDDGVYNIKFPIDDKCIPLSNYDYKLKIIDRRNNRTVSQPFHYDPIIGKFDPEALSEIDFWTPSDPARYNNGYGKNYSNNDEWGENQVGKIWWDISKLEYSPYTNTLPNFDSLTKEWGRLKYYKVRMSVVNGDTLLLDTYDPYTNVLVNHEFTNSGFTSILKDCNISYLNGLYVFNVVSQTRLQTKIRLANNDTILPDAELVVGSVDIYQWVRSTLTPKEFIANGYKNNTLVELPYGLETASYVTKTYYNNNKSVNYHYYWVKSTNIETKNKKYTAINIAQRIENPTKMGINWFAPINKTNMFFSNSEFVIDDDYTLQISIDERKFDTNEEWALLSENSDFFAPPRVVFDKIIDCILTKDKNNNNVPSSTLSIYEKYGTNTFPPQTIFKNVFNAQEVFFNSINKILKSKNLVNENDYIRLFKALNSTYYSVVSYKNETDYTIIDTVANMTELTRRKNLKYYVNGDYVKVINNTLKSPFDNSNVYIVYKINNTLTEVEIDKFTVQLSTNILNDVTLSRIIFEQLYDLLTDKEKNIWIFDILYEMIYQHNVCDWYEKTSYIDVNIKDKITNTKYVEPDEAQSILDNITDVKPYRTKLRNMLLTKQLETPEKVNVDINEDCLKKINVYFDRLNCTLSEEGGLDAFPLDIKGMDHIAIFDETNINYNKIAELVGNNTNLYYVYPTNNPNNFEYIIKMYYQNNLINLKDFNITYNIIKYDDIIKLIFSSNISNQFKIEIMETDIYYEDIPLEFNNDYKNTTIRRVKRSLQHNTHYYNELGYGNPCAQTNAQERVQMVNNDNVSIFVKTFHSKAYQGLDGSPVDIARLDVMLDDIGEMGYVSTLYDRDIIPAGNYMYPTSIEYNLNNNIVNDGSKYNLHSVYINNTLIEENKDYKVLDRNPNIVKVMDKQLYEFTSNGITNTYDISDIDGNIQEVRINNIPTVKYTLVGNNIVFDNIASNSTDGYYSNTYKSETGNALRDTFILPLADINFNKNNINFYVNGLYKDANEYDTLPNINALVLNTPLSSRSNIVSYNYIHAVMDNANVYDTYNYIGDGTTTSFNLSGTFSKNTMFVYINGSYMENNDDFTVDNSGVIFNTAPNNGDKITIKNFITTPNNYKIIYIKFMGNNTNTNIVTNYTSIADFDVSKIQIFLNDRLVDIYSSFNPEILFDKIGSNLILNWQNYTPVATDRIVIRGIYDYKINNFVINNYPFLNDKVSIYYKINNPNNKITLVYNKWNVGDIKTFRILPTNLEFEYNDNIISLTQNPVLNEFIHLQYLVDRKGDNKKCIYTKNIMINDIVQNNNERNSFYKYIWDGFRVAVMDDKIIYEWKNNQWIVYLSLVGYQFYYNTADSKQYIFNNVDMVEDNALNNKLDTTTYKTGLTASGYSYSQHIYSNSYYPAAYKVKQTMGSF